MSQQFPQSQERFADLVTWIMCEMADGGGPGKCDPQYCVCGTEGEVVARRLYERGYVLVRTAEDITPAEE